MADQFINERHRWLELKAASGMFMDKCWCGDCRDDEDELRRYRKELERQSEVLLTPYERLTQQFEGLSTMQRETLIDEFTADGG